jgi:hypothetical protein
MDSTMTPSRLVFLNVALLAIMILASRLALVVHEVGGHALPATLIGARKVDVRLSALGGGFVMPHFLADRPPSATGLAIFSLGGIALNLLTGLGTWIWARRLGSRGLGYVALLFYSVGSVAGGLSYLACGFYYGSGDPVGFAPVTEDLSRAQWLWVLFVPLTGAVTWIGARHFMDFLSGLWTLESPRRRVAGLLATAGLVGLCYGALWLALRDPRIEGSTRQWRLEQEVAKETLHRIEVRQAVRPTAPTAPTTPPPVPEVRPEEVADRLPSPLGPIVLYATAVIATLFGAARARPGPGSAPSDSPGLPPPSSRFSDFSGDKKPLHDPRSAAIVSAL